MTISRAIVGADDGEQVGVGGTAYGCTICLEPPRWGACPGERSDLAGHAREQVLVARVEQFVGDGPHGPATDLEFVVRIQAEEGGKQSRAMEGDEGSVAGFAVACRTHLQPAAVESLCLPDGACRGPGVNGAIERATTALERIGDAVARQGSGLASDLSPRMAMAGGGCHFSEIAGIQDAAVVAPLSAVAMAVDQAARGVGD
ncbi:hypothetical protein FQZ97_969930 [compost metagenome]